MHKLTLEEKERLLTDKFEDITVRQSKELLDKVEKRFIYCMDDLQKVFGVKFSWYAFENAEEGEIGVFERDWIDSIPYVRGHVSTLPDISSELQSFSRDYDYDIPTKWLWEDFEDELREDLEKHRLVSREKQKNLKEKKEREKSLIAQIKKKLTKEEIRFLFIEREIFQKKLK